jgi:hypothetical protein
MVTYHYVKFYGSIIIHLEVININVQISTFPKDSIVTPTPFEPLKIWLWPLLLNKTSDTCINKSELNQMMLIYLDYFNTFTW